MTIHTRSGGLIAHDIDTCICIVILVHAEFHPVQQLVVFPGNPLQGRRQLFEKLGGGGGGGGGLASRIEFVAHNESQIHIFGYF